MHKETSIRMFHEMLFRTTPAKMETTSIFIKRRKNNKMWHINIIGYDTADERNQLDLIIVVEKS